MVNGSRMMAEFVKMDRRLVEAGFPATSPWWMETLRRFYASGRRQLVLRVGRRGGKSSTLCRVGVCEAIVGDHAVPPGDIGVVAIVSVSRDEAAKRLRTIESILRTLQVGYRPLREGTGFELAVGERERPPIGFQVFTASIAGVSGPTVITAIGDEVAKWSDKDTGANPAKEVLASLRPTIATQRNAKLFLSSSPLSTVDAHAAAFDEGDDDFQLVAHAPTWVANPTITEAETHALERDPRLHAREYGAIPDDAIANAFPATAVLASVGREIVQGYRAAPTALCLDPNSGGRDSFGAGLVSWLHHEGHADPWLHTFTEEGTETVTWERDPAKLIPRPSLLLVRDMLEIEGGTWGRVKLDAIIAQIAAWAKPARVRVAYSDQRERQGIELELSRNGIRMHEIVWGVQNKIDAVSALARVIREDRLCIPPTDAGRTLARQLVGYRRKYLPSGAVRFEGARDDLASVLLTATMASQLGLIAGSPIKQQVSGPPTYEGPGWE